MFEPSPDISRITHWDSNSCKICWSCTKVLSTTSRLLVYFVSFIVYCDAYIIALLLSCPDPKSRVALKLSCDLYALNRIWNDIGTYRNVDYVAPNKAKVWVTVKSNWRHHNKLPLLRIYLESVLLVIMMCWTAGNTQVSRLLELPSEKHRRGTCQCVRSPRPRNEGSNRNAARCILTVHSICWFLMI